MAARETMRVHAQPLLEDGETIERIFPVTSGMHPLVPILCLVIGVFMPKTGWLLTAGLCLVGLGLVLAFVADYRVVAVTDRSLVVLSSGAFFVYRAKRLMARLPVDTRVGPMRGFLWVKAVGLSEALGERCFVHTRFRGAADSRIR